MKGILIMFFRKNKKERKEKERISNVAFGDLVYIDCWQGHSISSLFGEEENIDLYVYVDEEEKNIEEYQEKAYLKYIQSRKEIEEAVRNVIIKEFELSEDFDFRSRFEVNSIIVTVNGSCGISIVDYTYNIGHTNCRFVIETEPEYEFADSEQYYLETK